MCGRVTLNNLSFSFLVQIHQMKEHVMVSVAVVKSALMKGYVGHLVLHTKNF